MGERRRRRRRKVKAPSGNGAAAIDRMGPLETEYLSDFRRSYVDELEALVGSHPDAAVRDRYSALSPQQRFELFRQVAFVNHLSEMRLDLFPLALRDCVDRERIRAFVREILGARITAELGESVALEELWKARENEVTPERAAHVDDLTAYVREIVDLEGSKHRARFGRDRSKLGAEDRERWSTDRRAAQRLERRPIVAERPDVAAEQPLPEKRRTRVPLSEKSKEFSDDGARPDDLFISAEEARQVEERLREAGLTKRELELALALVLGGAPSTAEAARELEMNENTGRVHLANIRKKLAAQSGGPAGD